MNLFRITPINPKPAPSRTTVPGSGTAAAAGAAWPLTSRMTPVGPPPLLTIRSNVLMPEWKPPVIENGVRDPKPATEVHELVAVPLRDRQASLSEAQLPVNVAVLGFWPVRSNVVR
jgi:hypothetical protein